ncbi:MAG: hypothetical protein PVSMB7_23670 [Chloroflexota bacterium]
MHPTDIEWKQAASARFDEIATRWRARGMPAADQIDQLLRQLNCPPDGSVLDAGCGTANYTAALALRGIRVVGFDLSLEMIGQAQEVLREAGIPEARARVRVGDVERIEDADATFDAVLCRCVLDFAPHPGRAVKEFERVLKPGGRLVVINLGAHSPVKREWWRRFLPEYDGVHYGNDILPWEMEALLRDMGWRIMEQFPTFAPSNDGVANEYDEQRAAQFGDPILLQAIATGWTIAAESPAFG